LTLGLTSLHPHAVVPSLLSDEGKRIVLPAFFQRGRDFPDKTRQTLATAHAAVRYADAFQSGTWTDRHPAHWDGHLPHVSRRGTAGASPLPRKEACRRGHGNLAPHRESVGSFF